MNRNEQLFDHSTPRGKAKLYCKRVYRTWILSTLLLIGSFITIYTYIKNLNSNVSLTLSLGASPLPDYEINFSDGQLEVIGEGDLGSVGSDAAFITWPLPADTVLTSLKMKNVLIDAPSFSSSLQGHTSLTNIKLESVWITGEFTPVYLPSLTSFHLNQYRNEETDRYKPGMEIKNLLFFEMDPMKSWDAKLDLVNLPLDLHLSLGGTTILDISRNNGRINLNVHNCDLLLSNLNSTPPISKLTLSWCSITSSHIPNTLTYLNLNNAAPSSLELEMILNNTNKLEEFHGFLPPHIGSHEDVWNNNTEYTTVNINSLPSTLKVLSLSNINLIPNLKTSPPHFNLVELYVENSLNTKVSESIDKLFPNLKRFGMFNTFGGGGSTVYYKLLRKLINVCVEWILFEGFDRKGSFKGTGVKGEVEKLLNDFGIDETGKYFLIEGCRGNRSSVDEYAGSTLTLYERNYYRYTLLGFDQVDSYEDYVIWDRESKNK